LIHDLGEIFKTHERQHRIIYNEIFCINGQKKNDTEITNLKSKLVEVACNQKSWGKPMPMSWVPLELQMSELRLHNMTIISKEELITLNQRNNEVGDFSVVFFLSIYTEYLVVYYAVLPFVSFKYFSEIVDQLCFPIFAVFL
jgi:Ni,Fe-hydrogenase III component G